MVLNFKEFSLNENQVIKVRDLMNKYKLDDVKEMLIGKTIKLYESEISDNRLFLEAEITDVKIRQDGCFILFYKFGESKSITNITIYFHDIILIMEPEKIKEEDIEWY